MVLPQPATTQTDRDALTALYNATDGPNWRHKHHWNTAVDLSQWFGVSVNRSGRVIGLRFPGNGLRGPIPPELGNLGALTVLNLSGNQLSGAVPAQLGALSKLTTLNFSYNQLSGIIPPQLGQLGALEYLSLSNNKLDGPIPPELGNLGALTWLDLEGNQLSGPIPKELGALSELQELWLPSNQLSGPIPSDVGHLSALKELYLYNNQLSGPIPPELGRLKALVGLRLWGNQLSGSIPKELGALRRLEKLWLYSNNLTGPIPPELGNLAALQYLYLGDNELSGTIPKELAHLRQMEDLLLNGNPLEGPMPPRQYGIDMRDWGGIPTDEDKSRVREAGAKDPDKKRPLIVRGLDSVTDAWHGAVPVVDDVTDVLLLTSTADTTSPFWWICLISLVVADIERLWLLFTLCLTIVSLPPLWCYDEVQSRFLGSAAAHLFASLNCRPDAPPNTFRDRLKDSFLWVLVGSRSRCSPLWRLVGMSLEANVQEADRAGVGFGAIDKWVARHPFSFLGQFLFGKDFELKGGDDGVSRRAQVMIRAVGETLVVDSLFLALSVVSGGWDGNLTGVAGISALFSVLELLTELQYYVAEAGEVLVPVGSSDAPAVPADLEQGGVSDPCNADIETYE